MADMERSNDVKDQPDRNEKSHLEDASFPSAFPDRALQERGWLLPELLAADETLTGRWDYLTLCWYKKELIDHPIPRIHYESSPNHNTSKMLGSALDSIPNYGTGGWLGWSSYEYFRFFLEWLLHGFGHQAYKEAPKEPFGCEGASKRLANVLDLSMWVSHPHDYLGEMLSQNEYGRRQGFFPTPHNICEMMALMTIGTSETDTRALSVMDPCVGTGRMLLHASNYSMRLYGQDIDPVLCLATLANGYLYAPWLVRPLPFLDSAQYNPEQSEVISASMVDQAPPCQGGLFENTEHDSENQWRFEPIKKRRHRKTGGNDDKQSTLF